MIWFARPVFLPLILLFPLYIFLRKSGTISPFSLPLTLGNWGAPAFGWKPFFLNLASGVCVFLLSVSFFLGVFAAADFSVLEKTEYYSGTSLPVVFILDVSPSMSAPDMNGETRFDAAKNGIASFVRSRPGGLFGLAALASDAAMLVPPTTDTETFLHRLDALRIGELGEGTAIGMGLAVAASHLQGAKNSPSFAVLLTDGENNAGGIHPATAASFFRSSGISLILAGLGRKGYSEISYEDPVSGMQYSGRFYSGFDETSLLDIAAAAGGIYVRAADPDSLASVFSTLDASVPETAVAWSENARRSLSFPCAVLSLCFAAAAWMLRFLLLGGGICL